MDTNPKDYITVQGIDFHAPTIAAMSEADFVKSQMDNPEHWGHKGAAKEQTAKDAYAEVVLHNKERQAKAAKATAAKPEAGKHADAGPTKPA